MNSAGKRATERFYGNLQAFSEGSAVGDEIAYIDKTGKYIRKPAK